MRGVKLLFAYGASPRSNVAQRYVLILSLPLPPHFPPPPIVAFAKRIYTLIKTAMEIRYRRNSGYGKEIYGCRFYTGKFDATVELRAWNTTPHLLCVRR